MENLRALNPPQHSVNGDQAAAACQAHRVQVARSAGHESLVVVGSIQDGVGDPPGSPQSSIRKHSCNANDNQAGDSDWDLDNANGDAKGQGPHTGSDVFAGDLTQLDKSAGNEVFDGHDVFDMPHTSRDQQALLLSVASGHRSSRHGSSGEKLSSFPL